MQRSLPIPFAPLSSSFILALAVLLATPPVGNAVEANGPWGEYPNCIAPAIPLETHSWWLEAGTALPHHLHSGSCVPHARTTNGSQAEVRVTEPTEFTLRITTYNYEGNEVNWSRMQWVGDTYDQRDRGLACTPSDPSYSVVGGNGQCVWQVEHVLDPNQAHDGMDELRVTPNISDNEFGKRQFASAKYQVWTLGNSTYRSQAWPQGDSWYEGFDYCGARVGISELFEPGQTHLTKPLLSGVVRIPVDHDRCEGNDVTSLGWLDTSFHQHPEFWREPLPPVGQFHKHGGMLLYAEDGLFEGDVVLDTTQLCDGQHSLYFQSQDQRSEGMNAGALKVLVDTKNGNEPCDGTPTKPPACSDGLDNDFDEQTDFPNDLGCDDFSDDSEDSEITPPEEPAAPEEPAKPEDPAPPEEPAKPEEPSEPEQPVVGSEGDPGVQDANARRLERKLAKVERKIAKLETRRDGFTAHAASLKNLSATQVDPASGKLRRILNKRDKIEAKLQQLMAKQAVLLASLK